MNAVLFRSARLAAVLSVLCIVTGCLKINSTLMIRADGSGVWRVGYAMPGYMIRQAQMMRSIAGDLVKAGSGATTNQVVKPLDLPLLFEEDAIRARFKSLERDGLKLAKVETRSRSGWQYVDLTVTYDRLETLLREPFFSGCGFSLVRLGETSYKLTVALHSPERDQIPNMADPKTSANLTPFFRGLAVSSRIETPGNIRNTNAGISDDRMATWEWDFDKDASALERLLQDKMIVVFDAAGAHLPEFEIAASR